MSKRTKKKLNVNKVIVRNNSKTCSDSSMKIDNGFLTNKNIFIYYGPMKRDLKFELALTKLNAVIIDYFDDTVNCAITAVKRHESEVKTPPPPLPIKLACSRSMKMVGLVKKKTAACVLPNNGKNGVKKPHVLDKIAEKGIRIIQIQNVWQWLRQHHASLLQEIEETNDLRDKDNEVRKLIEPSLKILDITNATRPTFHQNCTFQSQLWEETITLLNGNKNEEMSDVTKSKGLDTAKLVRKKSTKIKKTNNKSDSGYCECCNLNYKSLISHLVSPLHLNFANNAHNFEGIDQVISDLSQLSAFFTVRLKKQTIMARQRSRASLVKSLSANDFKRESLIHSNIKKTPSLVEEIMLPLLHGNETEIVIPPLETVIAMVDTHDYIIAYTTHLCDYELHTALTTQTIVNAHWQETHTEEETVPLIDCIEEPCWSHLTVQTNALRLTNIDRPIYSYQGQPLNTNHVSETNDKLSFCDLSENPSTESSKENVVGIIETMKEFVGPSIAFNENAMNCTDINQSLKIGVIEEIETVATREDCENIMESSKENLPDCNNEPELDLGIFETPEHIEEDQEEDEDEDEDEDEEDDSSDSENFPKSLSFHKASFCSSVGIDLSSRSPWVHSTPPLLVSTTTEASHHSQYNAFSPFFLSNIDSSPHYDLLTPNYEYPPPNNNYPPSRDISLPPVHSPTQYQPHNTDPIIDPIVDLVIDPFIDLVVDPIIDLRQLVSINENGPFFNSLTTAGLSRPAKYLGLDQLVKKHFQNKYQIELPSNPATKTFLCEVTNIDNNKDWKSDRSKVLSSTKKRVKESPMVVASSPLIKTTRITRAHNLTPINYNTPSPDRLYRRAKSVARDSISLTTQLFLN